MILTDENGRRYKATKATRVQLSDAYILESLPSGYGSDEWKMCGNAKPNPKIKAAPPSCDTCDTETEGLWDDAQKLRDEDTK
jgi:hypothetical protein